MRIIFLYIGFTFFCSCNSEDSSSKAIKRPNLDNHFAIQLNQILSFANSGFQLLEDKKVILKTGETEYTSKITLDGTLLNRVGKIQDRPYYKANIVEQVNEKEAINIVSVWKEKIQVSLSDVKFETPFRKSDENSLRDGFIFQLEKNYVTLFWINKYGSEKYEVVIVVM